MERPFRGFWGRRVGAFTIRLGPVTKRLTSLFAAARITTRSGAARGRVSDDDSRLGGPIKRAKDGTVTRLPVSEGSLRTAGGLRLAVMGCPEAIDGFGLGRGELVRALPNGGAGRGKLEGQILLRADGADGCEAKGVPYPFIYGSP